MVHRRKKDLVDRIQDAYEETSPLVQFLVYPFTVPLHYDQWKKDYKRGFPKDKYLVVVNRKTGVRKRIKNPNYKKPKRVS